MTNDIPQIKKGRELSEQEKQEMYDGQKLYEMTQSPGWKVVEKWLVDRAHHSWVDPKGTDVEKEWVWRELNLFHSADVAKQLLEDIETIVNKADYLNKISTGEIVEGVRMKI